MRAAYYEQLDQINDDLVEMTRLVGSAMNRATQALLDADLPLAEAVIDFDAKVDTLASDVDRFLDAVFPRLRKNDGEQFPVQTVHSLVVHGDVGA